MNRYKCELIIGGATYNITDELANWDDIELSFKRRDYDGVVRSYSTKFEFAKLAYLNLKNEYLNHYLQSAATILFYATNGNYWEFNEVFRCALDFSTYEDDGHIISMNAVDNTLAALIKANKSTKYDFQISLLKEPKQLYYDRLLLQSNAEYVYTGTLNDEETMYINYVERGKYSIPIYIKSSEIAIKNVVEIRDVEQIRLYYNSEKIEDEEYPWFMKCIYEKPINVYLNVALSFITGEAAPGGFHAVGIYIKKYTYSTNSTSLIYYGAPVNGVLSIFYSGYLSMNQGDMIYIYYEFAGGNENLRYGIGQNVTNKDFVHIDYYSKGEPVSIDVIKPLQLLKKLVSSITGKDTYQCVIDYEDGNDRINNAIILSAESIRGIESAKIHTSYNDFSKWMSSLFGFVPVITDTVITFTNRKNVFVNSEVKELGELVNDFNYTVNPALIYSSVKVGYDKQEYDSVNGRDEFRFTNEFSTGIQLTDNTMELISPYRADAYGIEFLATKRGEDTKDSDSDTDVFFVGAAITYTPDSKEQYMLIRNIPISGVVSTETMFNAMYSPKSIIMENLMMIACCTSQLTFASTEGNGDVSINGIPENGNIEIPASERIFKSAEISIDTGYHDIPNILSGFVSFTYVGRQFQGFISNVDFSVGKSKSVTYKLIEKA
jgi:hypothetical protein